MCQVRKKGVIYGLILMFTLILSGCEKEASKVEEDTTLSVCADNTGKKYITDYRDIHITPDCRPLSTSFWVNGEKLYFIDTACDSEQRVCEVSLQGETVLKNIPIDLSGLSVKALAADNEEVLNPVIYCMAMNLSGNGFLAAFSHDGTEHWKTEFSDSLNQSMQENEVFRLIRDSEGRFYALSMQRIFLFDYVGVYQGEIECPGKSFLGISLCGEREVYVTYQSEDGKQPFLAQVKFEGRKLAEEKRVLGNGSLFQGEGNKLLLCDSASIYSCEPDSERVIKLFDFKDYDILSTELQTMWQADTGELVMVSWSLLMQSNPVELLRFREAGEGEVQEDGRKIITLLGMNPSYMESLFGEVIAEFNKQSKEYKVVLEIIGGQGDIYSRTNARLMAKESADLLYMTDYKDMEIYQKKGFLENLNPYIEQSEIMNREDYIEEIRRLFEVDGRLYGMWEVFGIETLMGRKSELGTHSGWTVEQCLDWLKQHPNARSECGLSKEILLEYCLKGSLEKYVDWEQGAAEFEKADFKELLSTICCLDTDDNTYYDNWYQVSGQSEAVLQGTVVGNFYNVYTELQYGDEVVFVGYPSEDGIPRHFLSMECLSILSRSNCKEGAYAFWEYFMTHGKFADCMYYTNKADFEAAMNKALESKVAIDYGTGAEEYVPVLTEEQLDRHKELLKYSTLDSLSAQTVRKIILEESQAYFKGDKGLEDTCKIIQSRVQLYLNENQ